MYLEKDLYLFKIFGNSFGQVFLRKAWFDLEFQILYLFFFIHNKFFGFYFDYLIVFPSFKTILLTSHLTHNQSDLPLILVPAGIWSYITSKSSRSSRPEVFCKNGVLRNFAKFSGKHLYQILFFNEVAGLRPELYQNENLAQLNFSKFLRTPFFIEHLWTTAFGRFRNNI